MFEKIEKAVFFTITRVFAWLVVLPAFAVMVFAGYKVATTYVAGTKPVEVSYEEVKAELERKENPWDAPKPAVMKKKKDKADEWNHEAKLQELLDVFGDQVDRFKARNYLQDVVMRHDPKDRTRYLNGFISVIKATPTERRLKAIDVYEELWVMAEASKEMEGTAAKAERMTQIWVLSGTFAVIALFSLILILLAIEKNTRKA